MEFSTNQPGGRSAHLDEVDLYDELAKFSSLSPEEQREKLERVEEAKAQPALTADDLTEASLSVTEHRDVPPGAEGEPNPVCEPFLSLVDEPRFEPLEQRPSSESAEPVFTFIDEPAKEASQSSQVCHLASSADDSLDVSPLEDIWSEALESPQPTRKCDSCGAASNPEDLFCPSCGQLQGEMS